METLRFCCCISTGNLRDYETKDKKPSWKDKKPSWSELLHVKGEHLWLVRDQVRKQNQDTLALNHSSKREFVKLIRDPKSLHNLEIENGLDKITDPQQDRKALTMVVGEEWIRQRSFVCASLTGLPKLSLEAASLVEWRKTLKLFSTHESEHSITVDLKHVIVQTSLEWTIGLFFGTEHINSEPCNTLKRASLEYWSQTRAFRKNKRSIQFALSSLEEAFPWNQSNHAAIEYGGFLKTLYASGLGPKEATDNAVNALLASLDAVQALVFWTLWNLSKTQGAWELCAATTDQESNMDKIRLAMFKKHATQGESCDLEGLSYLGRALAETVRVYPPVWTLPRNWHDSHFISSKVEVLSCNNATERTWDPSREPAAGHIASFGLGKRHCPAGTSGLYAAYDLVLKFVKSCKTIKECEPGKALNDCYLGPTLCLHGPQYFQVTLHDG
eukprot:scaffold25199_cov152-Cylindrotheca_fusiformis.AAC.3